MEINRYIKSQFYSSSNINKFFPQKAIFLLFALLAIDLTFMGLHTVKSLGYLNDPDFSITKNFGYAEIFQYLKAAFLALLFFTLGYKSGRPLFYCWFLVFTFILLDDSLELHEQFGYKLGAFFEQYLPILGFGNSVGEIIAFGTFGAIVFLPLIYFFFTGKDREMKIATQDIFLLFCGMILFAVGVDLLHDFATTGTFWNGFLGLLEDGGEMIIMSFIIWYVWSLAEEEGYAKKSLTGAGFQGTSSSFSQKKSPH